MDPTWPLVGRTRELELIAGLVRGGEHSGVVITGPAGVGKSWLAAAGLASAAAAGLPTARIAGSNAASRIPLGALAPLLPDTTGRSIEPGDMLRWARDALVALGQGRPVALLIDDAHLLDDASAILVHQVVASRAVFAIATVSTGEDAPDPLVAMWKDGLVERIELGPLALDDVEEVLARILGGRVAPATANQLFERSAGNALYLRELVRDSLESGSLRDEDGLWRLVGAPVVSTRLVELIQLRLRGVPDPERWVLEALAFGEPLGVGFLTAFASMEKLDELERRGLLITASDGRRMEASLAHPLYGEVIRSVGPVLRSPRHPPASG